MKSWAYNESAVKTECECAAGSDNTTSTLSCQDWYETCDPELNICGITSFTELFDAEGEDSANTFCIERKVPSWLIKYPLLAEITVIVDECTGAGLGPDDILGAYYNAFAVGSCNVTDMANGD